MQLIEPSLNSSEAKYIERLITIYMNPANSTNNSELDINEVVIHTIDDCLTDGPVEKMVTLFEQNRNSIWREAPGWWYSYSFHEKITKINPIFSDGLCWKSCPLGSLP